ncbi:MULTISPECIES: hypothetical protein [Micrococcaceae]|jgi:hypothetical protein|uniref:Uncharacterized protein n=1 Tax=Paenarthrobacter aromaticivorans TaxID=2849150 RepID=A0ABS6I2U1_9MICC|nr:MULTISPECIES: hypothetical protein [Micrococcaceae]MBU8865103.1 hypothetical protein [Paenarthrobacter sp. MMS21-TAE1-1]BCW04275.1 hypothetical protein NtRootA1_04130 [Arthrobacter sp. NtRootA1]
MTQTHEQESILRVSTDSGDTVSFTLDATKPVTVKLQVDGGCTCGTTATVQGSYVDSDLGQR